MGRSGDVVSLSVLETAEGRRRARRVVAGLGLACLLAIGLALGAPAVARGAGGTPTPAEDGHGPASTPTPADAGALATPTPDRLAEPTLPANPNPADQGAQVYWFSCMACHGDQGQGLTAEFRDLYPPDHVDCWKSGCHGPHPYENGFTLPRTVPAVIGPGALDAFHTAGDLYRFIHTAMPFQAPGRLADDAYWQVTAFLLRQNGFASGPEPLGPQDADTIIVGRGLRSPVPTVAAKPATIETPAPVTTAAQGPSGASFFLGLAAVMIVVAGAALWARARRRRPHP